MKKTDNAGPLFSIYYDEQGQTHLKPEECKRVCAQEGGAKNYPQYFVLAKSSKLFQVDANLRDKNQDGWRLVPVSYDCFNLYTQYLKNPTETRYRASSRQL